jgi:hypothetical protein
VKAVGVIILFALFFAQAIYNREEQRQEAAMRLREMNEIKALVYWAAARADSR